MNATSQYPVGRNWATSDVASLTSFGDCFSVKLSWNDGACLYEVFDTKEEAVTLLRRLGWNA